MKRNYLLLVIAFLCFAGKASAQTFQPCGADEMRKRLIAEHPDLLQKEADYEQQIQAALKKIDFHKIARTTGLDQSGNPDYWYDIPIVVHVIHDYNENGENMSDQTIFNDLKDWNAVYAKQNSDTADVIATYKHKIPGTNVPYIGNPHIRLHLATIDPNGNPTKGITRHRSYLTYNAGEFSKLDDWAPASYVNIWSVNGLSAQGSFQPAAYAHFPSDVTYIPFWDGIISISSYFSIDKTINHEMGHYFSLLHPWGNDNAAGVACGGSDNVDDTPPTTGHLNCTNLYDTTCAINYYVIYTDISGHDSLVNYPDTTNVQNIMDYSYCSKMFTAGQAARMHAALNADAGGRSNLWDSTNLVVTGVKDAAGNFVSRPQLKPKPEFSAVKNSGSNYMDRLNYFITPGVNISFHNETWNYDTLNSLTWNFFSANDTITPISTSISRTNFTDTFSQSGWIYLKMAATDKHVADTGFGRFPNAVFVADRNGTPGADYIEEWSGASAAKWPFFNYYGNEFHWQMDSTVGFDDHYCMKYVGFDSRIDPFMGATPVTGTPLGDVDDMFSVPVDLSSFTDTCNLNFWFASTSRSSSSLDINDSLEIDYATHSTINPLGGITWKKLVVLKKGNLINNGAASTYYTPSSVTEWSPQTVPLPAIARTAYTLFRFRYTPGVGADGTYSSGNNYYMDRVSFNRQPASVSSVKLTNMDVAVVPNPTNGDAWVVIKDASNASAKIIVSDVTGKVVYTTNQQLSNGEAQVLIPHSAIAVAGMYMVQTVTGNQSQTKKLVVY